MRTMLSALSMLPGIAFTTLPATGETVAVCLGDKSYYRVTTTKSAAELNAMYGVSEEQARALAQLVGLDAAAVSPLRAMAKG